MRVRSLLSTTLLAGAALAGCRSDLVISSSTTLSGTHRVRNFILSPGTTVTGGSGRNASPQAGDGMVIVTELARAALADGC